MVYNKHISTLYMDNIESKKDDNIELINNCMDISSLNETQLSKIKERLPEYHRGKALIGHQTSQTSYSLQTMNMISDSPISRMKQCLAQIDKKYQALMETYYKIEKKKLKLSDLENKTDKYSVLEKRKTNDEIKSTVILMNSTLRQIGRFQDMYDDIMKNNNIPKNWTEKDYEKQEIEHMIRSAFRLCIQDLSSHGRVSQACVEYFEQLGIHPQVGETLTREYLMTTQTKISNGIHVDVKDMYKFLDDMKDEFQESWKLAIERIGLSGVNSVEFMAGGNTKPQ